MTSTPAKRPNEPVTAQENKSTYFDKGSILQDMAVERHGKKIILPDDPAKMTARQAIKRLEKLEQDEEQLVTVNHVLDGVHYHDGLIALTKAMKNIYGWAEIKPTPSFFGPIPPNVISIAIGYGQKMRVVEGRMSLPNVPDEDSFVEPDKVPQGGFWTFRLSGMVRKKYEDQIAELVEEMVRIARTESIYKGQAIRLRADEDGDVDPNPEFMDLSNVVTPIFSQTVQTQIDTSIYALVRYTDMVKASGIPLKRGVLLEGPYGTGKTLVSYTTAQLAVENGWTFLSVDRAAGLKQALEFARRYMPAVVFAEDIDREVYGEERTVALDDVLNVIDGLESKSTEIMVVLTSNHVENISKAMLRPGRLDAVIRVEAPDAEAVQKLLRVYGRKLIPEDETLLQIGEKLDGQIPAVIREVVERAKLFAISLANGEAGWKVTEEALLASAESMTYHQGLMAKEGDERSPADKVLDAIGEALSGVLEIDGGKDNRKLLQHVIRGMGSVNNGLGVVQNQNRKISKQLENAEPAATESARNTAKIKEDTTKIRKAVIGG